MSDRFGNVVSDIHERLKNSKRIQKFFKGVRGEEENDGLRHGGLLPREKYDPIDYWVYYRLGSFFSREEAPVGWGNISD